MYNFVTHVLAGVHTRWWELEVLRSYKKMAVLNFKKISKLAL